MLNRLFIVLLFLIASLSTRCQTVSQNTDEDALSPSESEEGFQTIFDGETLNGWEGDSTYWRVENGSLIGEITPETLVASNSFIIWQGGTPDNFELKTEFRITENGNSGINYRSEQIDTIPHALRGYQADIDGKNRYTGQNYEEKKRTTLAYQGEQATITSQDNPDKPGSLRANVERNAWIHRDVTASLGESDSLKNHIKMGGWNEMHLVVNGNRLQHYVNGVLMSDVTDDDTVNRSMQGQLGVQVHVGPPMQVEYRNIKLKNL
ncbi:MAG: DUF1080 domain-containing protein [Bacteroidota bacterium]